LLAAMAAPVAMSEFFTPPHFRESPLTSRVKIGKSEH